VAQRAGIPLAAIHEALGEVPAGRTPTLEDWHRLSSRWKAMLESRIADLLQLRDQLESCIGCGCLSLQECPLRNPADTLGQSGKGAVLLRRS
jgi:MerR family redox-sensitive transcriptional activator SoxR